MSTYPDRPGKWLHDLQMLQSRLQTIEPNWCGKVPLEQIEKNVELEFLDDDDVMFGKFVTWRDAPKAFGCTPEMIALLGPLLDSFIQTDSVLGRLSENKPTRGDDPDGLERLADVIDKAVNRLASLPKVTPTSPAPTPPTTPGVPGWSRAELLEMTKNHASHAMSATTFQRLREHAKIVDGGKGYRYTADELRRLIDAVPTEAPSFRTRIDAWRALVAVALGTK